jgi:excisionase family DNA binding protein
MTRMGLIPARLARPTNVVVRDAGEFTPAEIAGRLNMPEGTVYLWLYKNRLPARRAEAADRSLWLVRLEDVERLLQQRGPGGRLPSRKPT